MTNFTCIGRGHGAPAIPASREDWEKMRSAPWLADMCRRIAEGEEKLKSKLPIWTPHCAEFRNNHRAIADALMPLNRLMLDFDEKGHSAEILERSLKLQEEGRWTVLMVEESVRKGTHVLIVLPQGMTAETAQAQFSKEVGFDADGVVKDVSRCIYMVPQANTLYVNEEMFEPGVVAEAVAKVDVTHTPPAPSQEGSHVTHTPLDPLTPTSSPLERGLGVCEKHPPVQNYPTTYEGIPYTDIVETLEEQMGGKPDLGSRNNFIFSMACHLRHICNDDPAWIARILPTYGEVPAKWQQTIGSACKRIQSRAMPRIVSRTLDVCRRRAWEEKDSDEDNSLPPPMPGQLPPLIELLVSRTPEIYRPAVAHAVFPALGTHLWRTTFRYIDNVEHEATLMNCLMAGTGAGKNCITEPINHIMTDIRDRDRENLQREKEWKNEMLTKGANKDKRKRPEGIVVQEIDADMTNAALVMRLAEAEGRFLYTKLNELDQFDALKTSSRSKAHFQIMCLAFDPGNTYGQTRVGTSSVSERVCVRLNWNASTTIRKGQSYFRNVLTDGPISRINFCTIPERPIGSEMPVYGSYGEEFDEELRPYIERLNNARGLVECEEAVCLARKLMEENAEFARLSESRVYENLSFRANVIAYLKAMVLFVAHGGVWDETFEDFIRWSLQYDMWCKMKFFGNQIEEEENGVSQTVRKGPQNLLDQLPEVFTREEAQLLRKRMDIRQGSLKQMLANWKHRGYIELYAGEPMPEDRQLQKYCKTETYLSLHPQRISDFRFQ